MKVLNVGGNNKAIGIPGVFEGWEHHLLDIDKKGKPDICADARDLASMEEYKGNYDAVYCSHVIEHFYTHDVPKVLNGFFSVTGSHGFVWIACPNLKEVVKRVYEGNMELSDPLYRLSSGEPITSLDVLFGWGREIEQSGQDFFSHKTGFTVGSLSRAVYDAGFKHIKAQEVGLELLVVGFKNKEDISIIEKHYEAS